MARKSKKPIVAIMYDFDNTLSTKDMQEYTFIPSVHESAKSFWEETRKTAKEGKMDGILAYMYVMLRKAKAAKKPITRNAFVREGRSIKLFPGVREWFARINEYGDKHGVKIEHYIISSGLKEIIEGCGDIEKEFREIYACEFHYDENGVADWPKLAVNYTNKTQFLFRINKGCLDVSNDTELNKAIPDDLRPVPFKNMIYIGDGLTDVPCMKLVKMNGGHSIAVYSSKKSTITQLIQDNRVNFVAKADYRENAELDKLVKDIIDQIAAVTKLIHR